MPHDIDDRIRERAYHLWEAAGRPHGREHEFWDEASRLEHAAPAKAPRRVKPKPAKAPAAEPVPARTKAKKGKAAEPAPEPPRSKGARRTK